ncbi:MAG: carbohydrate kinase [Anaerolineales bacterium]|nr:carbohydrate kinase [Anaerolineales bacterium]
MKKEFDVVTLGELLIDMFPGKIGARIGEVDSFIPKPGGAPANVAVAASRLGYKSAFIGKVGQDHFGTYLKGVLDAEGVNTRGLCFDPDARTTMAIIAMPDENTAEFVFYRNPGADQCLTIDDLDLDLLQSTKILHFCSVSLTDEPARSATYEAVRIAREAGALVSYDVNYRPSLWKDPGQALTEAAAMIKEVNLVKVNEQEAALLTGMEYLDPTDPVQVESAALTLLNMGPEIVVVTLGAEGSYFQINKGGAYVPPFKVETIDAVGCGDAFVAGLLTMLVGQDDWKEKLSLEKLKEFLRFANAVGALTSLKRGAIPAMPDRKEVDDFLINRN